MKIKISVAAAKNGGALYTLVDDLSNLNSGVKKEQKNDILTIDDTDAPQDQKLDIDQATLLSILADPNGEMTEHLMMIRVDDSFGVLPVTEGLPRRLNVIDQVRTFVNWFIDGSVVYMENVGTGIIFSSNPAGGLAGKSDYLTGSQMEIIRQLDTINYSILTVAEADVIVETGWTQKVWGS